MLIVLTGPTSSGKTSLARALQALSPGPLFHLEADSFWPKLPPNHAVLRDKTDKLPLTVVVHRAIATLGNTKLDIIVDGFLPTDPQLRDTCLEILMSVPGTRVIALDCGLDELRRREASRGDRELGVAERQALDIHTGVAYDLLIDTSNQSPEEAATYLLAKLAE